MIFALAAVCALALSIGICGRKEAVQAETWVDNILILSSTELKRELPEYPGVLFRWTPVGVSAVSDGREEALFHGMPVWNVYLADLTGDGRREFCATVSFGSGMIDERVLVYDYDARTLYELSDRGNFDYTLTLKDGGLTVTRRTYDHREEEGISAPLSLNGVGGRAFTATTVKD